MNDIRIDWIILIVTFIIGCLVIHKQPSSYLKTIPVFLLITLLVELVGRYYRLKSVNNVFLFNIYSVGQLTYFTITLYFILRKSFILGLGLFIPVICLLNIFFLQGIKTFHTYTYAISVILIVFTCIYYYYYIFKIAVIENLLREPSFWFVTGLLIFYATSLSVIGIMNFIAELPPDLIRMTRNILLNVNGIFYFILLIALVCPIINIRKSIRKS